MLCNGDTMNMCGTCDMGRKNFFPIGPSFFFCTAPPPQKNYLTRYQKFVPPPNLGAFVSLNIKTTYVGNVCFLLNCVLITRMPTSANGMLCSGNTMNMCGMCGMGGKFFSVGPTFFPLQKKNVPQYQNIFSSHPSPAPSSTRVGGYLQFLGVYKEAFAGGACRCTFVQ